MSMLSFSAGGINVADIVGGLMDAERMALTTIERRKGVVNTQVASLKALTSGLNDLRTAALALSSSTFSKLTSTSSSSAVTATLGTSATTGSISFTVNKLAQAHGMRTAGTVATSSSIVTSSPLLAVSSATGGLGIGSVQVGAGLSAGDLQLKVTQASAGASITGGGALAASTAIGPGNDELTIEVNGAARVVTLQHGSYTNTDLVQAINDELGGDATASLDASGRLRITTAREGSTATLQVTGGNAAAALGLSPGAVANGIDGVVTVNGEATTVTSVTAGQTVNVDTGSGTLGVTLGGGLRVGEAKVAVVSTGDGSLASVASAINGAKVGVAASAVRINEGAWVLQLSSSSAGSAGRIAIDPSAFAGLGGLVETSTAQDAEITIGNGAGAYQITGRGNSFADVLPGVVLTANAISGTPVTVGVTRDDNSAVNAVKQLIDKANVLLAQVANQTRFDPETRASGPLSGQSAVRRLADDLRSAIMNAVPNTVNGLPSSVGISTTREGRFEFDEAKFRAALTADPAAVARLFGHGGTSTEGVSFRNAHDKTIAGTHPIVVTQAPTRAAATGVLSGGQAIAQQLSVRMGSTTVTYEASPGASAAEIADGLRTAFASAGIAIDVAVNGSDVALTSRSFGGSGSFEYSVDPGDPGSWQSATGQDVAGTIGGVTAIGVGNVLRLTDLASSNARGLEVAVDENFIGVADVVYEPGIAARVAALGTRLTGENGSLTLTGKGLDDRLKAFNTQIDRFEDKMARMELRLVRQWSSIQTLLQSMQSQGDWLGSQVSAMNRQPSR